MVEKKYECSVCGNKYHTRKRRDEHTLGRHRDEVIVPWEDNVAGYTDKHIRGVED